MESSNRPEERCALLISSSLACLSAAAACLSARLACLLAVEAHSGWPDSGARAPTVWAGQLLRTTNRRAFRARQERRPTRYTRDATRASQPAAIRTTAPRASRAPPTRDDCTVCIKRRTPPWFRSTIAQTADARRQATIVPPQTPIPAKFLPSACSACTTNTRPNPAVPRSPLEAAC